MNGTGILRRPPESSSSSTAAEVAVVDDMKESCSQFWLLRFWKRMDPKERTLNLGERKKKKMKKHKSVVNNAECNNNNNGGKKNQSLLPRRQNASAKWQRAQIAQTGTASSSSSRNPNCWACLETLLSLIGLSWDPYDEWRVPTQSAGRR